MLIIHIKQIYCFQLWPSFFYLLDFVLCKLPHAPKNDNINNSTDGLLLLIFFSFTLNSPTNTMPTPFEDFDGLYYCQTKPCLSVLFWWFDVEGSSFFQYFIIIFLFYVCRQTIWQSGIIGDKEGAKLTPSIIKGMYKTKKS